jgi:hypothetical protein
MGWQPVILETYRARAEKVAVSIGEQLKTPTILDRAVALSSEQSRYFTWSHCGFASGLAGLSLLWAHFDRCYPHAGWGEQAHKCLAMAVKDAEAQGSVTPGLFGGLAGLGFAAQYAARGTSRYAGLLNKIDRYITGLVGQTIGLFSREEPTFGAPVEFFDLISGLSGTAVYLLTRSRTSNEIDQTVKAILQCFVRLAVERDGVPSWHTPKAFLNPHDSMSQSFPNGHLNCGLAHGIPGPLGAMALARILEIEVEGLDDAIAYLASWLLKHRHDDSWGMNWPSGIALMIEGDRVRMGTAAEAPPAHSAWCYGSPGISRSLHLSGLALNRSDLCVAAVDSIAATLRRSAAARALNSPTFCHGTAGLLQIVLRFLAEAPNRNLEGGVHNLLSTLLAQHDPQSLVGVQSRGPEGITIDSPSLLDGAAGVALVLLSISHDVEPEWDRAFLLS